MPVFPGQCSARFVSVRPIGGDPWTGIHTVRPWSTIVRSGDAWLSMNYFPAMAAADEVGLFQALCVGRSSTNELAARLELDGRALLILLGLLGGLGFVERREGLWQATLVTRTYLDPSGRFFWYSMLRTFKERTPDCAKIVAALRKDEPTSRVARPSDDDSGKGRVGCRCRAAHRGIHAREQSRRLVRRCARRRLRRRQAPARCRWLVRRFLGGHRASLVSTARHRDGSPHDVRGRAALHREGGCGGRVDTVAVDMFREPWPTGYDALFFSNIYHDWDDRVCSELSEKAFDRRCRGTDASSSTKC